MVPSVCLLLSLATAGEMSTASQGSGKEGREPHYFGLFGVDDPQALAPSW